jgi:glycosyltransferase involved in cell wall biosynthesis
MPRVSVIIPSYNHEKYVAEAIQSVLDQTYQDFEIIITDDGSTDRTVSEIQNFKDSRISLFVSEKNRGACVAARKCLDEAKGEYIAVLSSDDVFLPDKLKKQVKFLDEHPAIRAVFGYAHIIDDDGNDLTDEHHPYLTIFKQHSRTRFEWLNHFFYRGNCLCHPSVLIRHKCYDEVGYYDERYAQLPDFDFWIRLCMKYDIHILEENLVKFRVRINDSNASGNRRDSAIRLPWEYLHILENYLDVKTPEEFLRIFPEAQKYSKKFEKRLLPFFLAKLALETDSTLHQSFALNILYRLLNKPSIRNMLEKKYHFSFIDFIKLTGEYDIFNYYRLCDKDKIINELREQLQQKDELLTK